jgi:hypothetical protein
MAWVVLSDMVWVDFKKVLLALQFSFDAVFLHQWGQCKPIKLPHLRQLIRMRFFEVAMEARP